MVSEGRVTVGVIGGSQILGLRDMPASHILLSVIHIINICTWTFLYVALQNTMPIIQHTIMLIYTRYR